MIVQLTWNKRKQSKLESNFKLVPPPLHKQKKREKTIGKNWSECGEGRGSIVHSPFSKESHSSSWRRAFIARGVKTSLRLGSAQKNKPHLRWSRRGATRGLIKRSEPMKTRSYIRYLFHSSYLHTHTHTETHKYRHVYTHRPGYNSPIVPKGVKRVIIIIHKRRPGLGFADQRHGNPKEGSRGRMKMVNRRNLEVACRRLRVSRREYRVERIEISLSVSLLGVLRGDSAVQKGRIPSARWDGGSGYDLPVSILFRKFIIRYVFVIRTMEGNRDPIFTLFYFVSPVQTRISRERRIFV